jgi:hypothetical protein
LKDEGLLHRRVITVSVPANADPALVLFSEGVEVGPGDEFCTVETSGNADVQIETDEAG